MIGFFNMLNSLICELHFGVWNFMRVLIGFAEMICLCGDLFDCVISWINCDEFVNCDLNFEIVDFSERDL